MSFSFFSRLFVFFFFFAWACCVLFYFILIEELQHMRLTWYFKKLGNTVNSDVCLCFFLLLFT